MKIEDFEANISLKALEKLISELEQELNFQKSNPQADIAGATKQIEVVKELAEKYRVFLGDKFIPANPFSHFPNVIV